MKTYSTMQGEESVHTIFFFFFQNNYQYFRISENLLLYRISCLQKSIGTTFDTVCQVGEKHTNKRYWGMLVLPIIGEKSLKHLCKQQII